MEKARIEQPKSLNGKLRLELAPQLPEIGRLVEAFKEFAARHGISPTVTHDVTLVLDELITNVVEHGIEPGEILPIVVDVDFAAPTLRILVSDPGRPFDPRNAPLPDLDLPLEERKIGGLGIHFARTFMDSLDYRFDGGRNHLTLVKRIAKDR
jgi:serine/threonine-protein kinase RsbW